MILEVAVRVVTRNDDELLAFDKLWANVHVERRLFVLVVYLPMLAAGNLNCVQFRIAR